MSIFTTTMQYVGFPGLAGRADRKWTMAPPNGGVVTGDEASAGVTIEGTGPLNSAANLYKESAFIGVISTGGTGVYSYATASDQLALVASGMSNLLLRDDSGIILARGDYYFDLEGVKPSISSAVVDRLNRTLSVVVNPGTIEELSFQYHLGSVPQPSIDGVAQSKGLGESPVTTQTVHIFTGIPSGSYDGFFRLHWKRPDDDWSTSIIYGRYVDTTIEIDINDTLRDVSGFDQLTLPVSDRTYGHYMLSDHSALISPPGFWYLSNSANIAVETLTSGRALIARLIPRTTGSVGSNQINSALYLPTMAIDQSVITLSFYMRLRSGFSAGIDPNKQRILFGFGLRSVSESAGGGTGYDGFALQWAAVGNGDGSIQPAILSHYGDPVTTTDGEMILAEVAGIRQILRPNVWSMYDICLTLNSQGNADGNLCAYIDGVKVIEILDMEVHDGLVPNCRAITWANQYGGGTDYRPATTSYFEFKNGAYDVDDGIPEPYRVLDVEASESGFRIKDSSGKVVDRFAESQTYTIIIPLIDSDGIYSGVSSPQIINASTSLGTISFVSKSGVENTYTYSSPSIETDTTVTISWGKYDDPGLTTSQNASVTVDLIADVIVTQPSVLTLTRSGSVITADVGLQVNAPCRVYYGASGTGPWTARTPSEDSSNYGVAPHHRQSFAASAGTIYVYARDHIWSTYTTDVKSITIPTDPVVDTSGYVGFLNVGTTTQPVGTVTKSEFNAMTAGLPNYYQTVYEGNMSVAQVDGRWALGARLTPNTNAYSGNGTDRIQSGHAFNAPKQDVYVSQWFYIPSAMDWGGPDGRASGKIGVGLFGGTPVSGGNPNPGGFSLRPIWKGFKSDNGTAELGLYEYSATQVKSYGDEIKGTSSEFTGFNGGNARLISQGWHHIVMRVKVNTSSGASDGLVQFWHNGDLIYNKTGKRWISTGTPQIETIRGGTFMGGTNANGYSWSPSKVQTLYLADWAYKIG